MAVGLQFFNYGTMNQGFLPDWCWGEDDLDFGVAEPKQVFVGPGPRLDCFPERPLTPEEVLIAEEEIRNDTDMIEVGEKISFVDPWETEIFRPLKTKLEFSLAAAANLARILGYAKEEIDDFAAQVIGFYLAQDGEGDIAGMDGVIGFYLSSPDNLDIAASVKTFAQRMKPYCPELSEGFRMRLIEEARENKNYMASEIGAILFGPMTFKNWVS